MTDEEILRKFIESTEQPLATAPGAAATIAERVGQKPVVVIGTSGSADYLRDGAADRRFWPVAVPSAARAEVPDDGQTCDGLHDEDAPAIYLCSRCFPNGEIPADHDGDGYDQPSRDDHDEME